MAAPKKTGTKTSAASKADKIQDAKTMKGMTPSQKAKFKSADTKMDSKRGLTAKQDLKSDNALAKKIKKAK